jgi:hypothetical protein
MFNSPDGIKHYEAGILYIQTDGKYSNKGDFAGMCSNQMLATDHEAAAVAAASWSARRSVRSQA